MTEFLFADGNLPFSTALFVMIGIALLEGISTLLFGGLSQLLDAMIPDFDLDLDLDVDADADLDVDADLDLHAHGGDALSGGVFTQTLTWLRIGQVPILILLVIFLATFSLLGLTLQGFVAGFGLGLLPASLAWIPVLAVSLPVVRLLGGWMARIMPKVETSAVSRETFVGRVAEVVLGTARTNEPAQARLRDQHGKTHYVMVEPDVEGEELPSGIPILLVRVQGARFRAIPVPSDALIDAREA